jgi:putative hydrolase of the HAD superfamily
MRASSIASGSGAAEVTTERLLAEDVHETLARYGGATMTRTVRPVQAVLFDYGGVLRRDERASAYDAIDAEFGLTPGALWWAMHDIPEYRLSREGAIDRAAYRAAVRRALVEREGVDGRVDAALAAFDAHIAALPPLDSDMHGLLDDLRKAGRVKLGLLSNAPRGFTERLRAAGVTPLFDDAFVSGDIGLAKPDPAVYRFAAGRLGVEPVACLMIDDQMRNIEGAHTAGLRTHFFAHARLPDLRARLTADGALG